MQKNKQAYYNKLWNLDCIAVSIFAVILIDFYKYRNCDEEAYIMKPIIVKLLFSSESLGCQLTKEDLPVLHQHLLPDDLADDLRADAEQDGDGGVGVVEAVQQNLWHLSLLLPYEPVRIRRFVMLSMI